jgi:hypothetical protein
LRRARAAVADLVSRLDGVVPVICLDSGILFNPCCLGGLDVITGLRVTGFGGDFLLMFIFILLGGLFILNGVAAGAGAPRVLASRLCAASDLSLPVYVEYVLPRLSPFSVPWPPLAFAYF